MIKPDWYKFRAKFSENPQANFEWFCYLLFCKMFDKPFGISRYKNQLGIETDTIIEAGEVIGWQAKFYETTLSDHKDEIIKSIKDSKKRYSEITKLIFFTNKEWGQGKNENDPKAKIEIEKLATDLDIKLEWKTASFFESPFVTTNNEAISQHFFRLENSIVDFLEQKREHSVRILKDIQTGIPFNGKVIEFDRSNILQHLDEELKNKQVFIISGVGGVGKTAVVKKFFETKTNEIPIYIFKSTEFQLNNIDELFPGFNLNEFIKFHDSQSEKIIIIDSAEKLLDLQNLEPAKEFFNVLIDKNWKLIFTTRYNYLDDINYQFIDIYNIVPINFKIQNPSIEDLRKLSEQFDFTIPGDHKLLELISNPFYLNEYLKFYKSDEKLDYLEFREKLWNKVIKKANPVREQCFMQIAFQRSNEGQFFIMPICDSQILKEFVQEGILGYEAAGYFISHDIYEEWALEKVIEANYIKKEGNNQFFLDIGKSLPIRRSFRSWLSQKLLVENQSIKSFIEEIIVSENIDSFWKDETIIAVLLSDYSEFFFKQFAEKLLEKNNELLRRVTFLLRIACKKIDDNFFNQLGVKNSDVLSMKYVFTKPKGEGWKSYIKFVHKNLDKIGERFIGFILPVLKDWNSKFKNGETTRYSSLLALKYYEWTIEEDLRWSDRNNENNIFETILFGAAEIKNELKKIFGEVILKKWKNHKDPYNELIKKILVGFGANFEVIGQLPEDILALIDLYWFKVQEEDDKENWFSRRDDITDYFSMEDEHLEYFPASAFQTPIYWLLHSSFKNTIDFILDFTNRAVEYYVQSTLDKNEVEEIEVYIGEDKRIKQFISNRLWNMYRGTQVAPHALESMHMALEKVLLEIGKDLDSKKLESWLIYLISNSKSASISAIVTSIVLAYPEKTFNVAAILFRTKEFFLYETGRYILDQTAVSQFSIGLGMNPDRDLYSNERIKTCEDKHRKMALEHLAFNYQFFKTDEVNDEEFTNRQKQIWDILDEYYKKLPKDSKQSETEETWQLFLARMDRRKMKVTTEEKDGKLLINFTPELDPKLKNSSENSLNQINERTKYISLNLWANYKIKNEQNHKQYEKYESNPLLALEEVKEIIKSFNKEVENGFDLFNRSIPSNVCSVLIRYFFDKLSDVDKDFCKGIILESAVSTLQNNYQYQIMDGVGNSISILPILLKYFPNEKEKIKIILLIVLFDHHPLGFNGKFSDHAVNALHSLWEISFDDAQAILFGYILFSPIYDKVIDIIRKDNREKGIYQISISDVNKRFLAENEESLALMAKNKITINDLKEIENLNSSALNSAFNLIPLKVPNKELKVIVTSIIDSICNKLFPQEKKDKEREDFEIRHNFIRRFAYFVLSSEKEDIPDLLKPFIDNFNGSEIFGDFFQEIFFAEDHLEAYEKFWIIWELFYEKIKDLCKDGDSHWYVSKIIKSYLFAAATLPETAKEWHSLKEKDGLFFKKVLESIGHCPSALYSISKLLNEIGSNFLNQGISWIAEMLKKNKNLLKDDLETNTVYYIEGLIRRFIFKEREAIKKNVKLKNEVLLILDFLVEKGSVTGYLLRENIL